MRIVLFNDEGQSIGSVDYAGSTGRAHVFELLDLVEKLLETGWGDCSESKADPLPGVTGL